MSFIEKAIELVSPSWALKRAWAKAGINEVRNYDAARTDRLGNDWITVDGTAEQIDRHQRDIIRKRARNLERNSDLAEGVASALDRNVVGTGIKPQPKVRKKSGELDVKTNKTLETLWKIWAKPQNCDITGQSDFYELQSLAIRRWCYDGEAFFNKTSEKAKIPFQLQMMEPDRVGSMNLSYMDNAILSGVEVKDTLRPVAYWFYHIDPQGFQTYEPYRIEAKNMIHLWKKKQATQVRGISELARVMQRIHNIDEYLDAEMIAARVAACFAAFVETDDGQTTGRTMTNDKGQKLDNLTPGIVQYLRPGQKMTFAEPKRNAGTAREYVEIQSRKTAAGVGLSADVVTRKIDGNFSAARQNLLEDRKTFIPIQRFLITHFCQPVWEEFITACVLAGLINAPDFFSDQERYFDCVWVTPGWTWIDPLKEVNASKEELKAGITTLAEVCGTQGKDWQEVLEQAATEKAMAEELGLELDIYIQDQQPLDPSLFEDPPNQTTKGVGAQDGAEE
ncbi:phage portal protein [Pelosinus sp. UFO1]|uniref:phage portal protein n=1 Tax=Pelosinus sp. UFO1 TaxID=484770 RepID=UPI0004D18DBF|nr:phage portal protein [Pelosinus sp. UFO1]AIF52009.1 phage portal protein, lambda family [Pelosinus sp. UFO1]